LNKVKVNGVEITHSDLESRVAFVGFVPRLVLHSNFQMCKEEVDMAAQGNESE